MLGVVVGFVGVIAGLFVNLFDAVVVVVVIVVGGGGVVVVAVGVVRCCWRWRCWYCCEC